MWMEFHLCCLKKLNITLEKIRATSFTLDNPNKHSYQGFFTVTMWTDIHGPKRMNPTDFHDPFSSVAFSEWNISTPHGWIASAVWCRDSWSFVNFGEFFSSNIHKMKFTTYTYTFI